MESAINMLCVFALLGLEPVPVSQPTVEVVTWEQMRAMRPEGTRGRALWNPATNTIYRTDGIMAEADEAAEAAKLALSATLYPDDLEKRPAWLAENFYRLDGRHYGRVGFVAKHYGSAREYWPPCT